MARHLTQRIRTIVLDNTEDIYFGKQIRNCDRYKKCNQVIEFELMFTNLWTSEYFKHSWYTHPVSRAIYLFFDDLQF